MKKIIPILFIAFTVFIAKPSNALGQSCPAVPTNTGTVTLSATTTAGTYRVWSRIKSADTTNNNFYLRINSACAVLVGDNNQISSTNWTWVDYQNGNIASKIDVALTAGTHVITLIGNEPGVSIDKILLTKNLSCIPTGVGDNCPAETPTATPPPDTTPPLITNVTVASLTSTGAEISWNLNEGGTGQIEYGTTIGYGLTTAKENGYLTFHKQTLSGLTPGTLYHYRIKSLDTAGNTALLTDRTFTTLGGVTPTPGSRPTATPTLRPTTTPIPTSAPTPIPTIAPTSTPTPSPLPSDTILRFPVIKLHGIGKGGDNTNPNLNGNLNPRTTTRPLSVELYNTSGGLISTAQGNIVYSAASGIFIGDIKLDTTIASGSYLVKVKSDKYIKKQLVGITTINKSSINIMPEVTLVVGDSNGDLQLSILDYNIIIDCYSDLQAARNCTDPAKKTSADLSDDGKVNQDDYNLLLREMSVITGD